jgi:hypothetical protein
MCLDEPVKMDPSEYIEDKGYRKWVSNLGYWTVAMGHIEGPHISNN